MLKLGDKDVMDLYFGNKEVKAAYLGDKLVYLARLKFLNIHSLNACKAYRSISSER